MTTTTVNFGDQDIVVEISDPTAAALAADAAASAASAAASAAAAGAGSTAAEAAQTAAEAARDTAQSISVTGFTYLVPVATATTANVTLSGEQTIDGVLTSTSRILVKNQTAPAENGVYVTAAGAWSRATDMDAAGEVEKRAVFVSGGTTNGGKSFATYSAVTTLGTDAIAFVEVADSGAVQDQIDALDGVIPIASNTAYYPAPIHQFPGVSANSNLVFGTNFQWTRTTGTGSFFTESRLSALQKTWTTVEVRLPASGTFSTAPFVQLLDASRVQIGSNVSGTLVDGEYVFSVTLSGSPEWVRVRWSTTSDGSSGWPYMIEGGISLVNVNTQTKAGEWVIEEWHDELLARSSNLFSGLPYAQDFTTIAGSAATIDPAGTIVTVPSASLTICNIPVHGMFANSDYVAVLCRMHSPATSFASVEVRAGDFQAGSTGTTDYKMFQSGEYFVAMVKAQTSASGPCELVQLRIDGRTNGLIPATAVTLEVIGLFNIPNETWVGRLLADPAKLVERVAQREQTVGFVSSTADADAVNTYPNLAEAVRAGHGTIYCPQTQRLANGLTIVGNRTIYMQAGASLRFSDELTIADFAATTADANVYFRAATNDALAMFELNGTSVLRMEASNPSGIGLYTGTASEAAVQATAGTYWRGTGSEGTGDYIRPFGDVTAGKTFERPRAEVGIVVPRNSVARIVQSASGVSGFSRGTLAQHTGSLTLEGGVWGYTGEGVNVIRPVTNSYAYTGLVNCSITEAGNDGYNDGPGSGFVQTLAVDNVQCVGNWQDAVATGHSTGRTKVYMRGRVDLSNNGKQGFVTIGLCDIEADCLVARNCRDDEVLFQHSKSGLNTVNIASADIETFSISLTGGATSAGRVVGLVDTVTNAGSVTVVQLATTP